MVGFCFKVTAAACCFSVHNRFIWYYPFRWKIANAYANPALPEKKTPWERTFWNERAELFPENCWKQFDLSSQIPGGSTAASEGPGKATTERNPLAWIQLCLCTPRRVPTATGNFLQDPQILFENHRLKTHPPLNKLYCSLYPGSFSRSSFSACSLSLDTDFLPLCC